VVIFLILGLKALSYPYIRKAASNDENNYRDITLLCTFGKHFTRILNLRLSEWSKNIYVEAQAACRQKMSTVDNIFVLRGLLTRVINQGKQLYCAFVDFIKAFDNVQEIFGTNFSNTD